MSHIRVGGGAAGFVFVAATVYIFLTGVPAMRWFLLGALALGLLFSRILSLFYRHKPTRPFDRIAG